MKAILLGILAFASLLSIPTEAGQPQLDMCNGRRNTPTKTCLVDRDTLWLSGEDIRLKSFDTPEPQSNICGGKAEVALAHRASARMLQLLNGNDWTIERFGMDNTGHRRPAIIRIGGIDVGTCPPLAGRR